MTQTDEARALTEKIERLQTMDQWTRAAVLDVLVMALHQARREGAEQMRTEAVKVITENIVCYAGDIKIMRPRKGGDTTGLDYADAIGRLPLPGDDLSQGTAEQPSVHPKAGDVDG